MRKNFAFMILATAVCAMPALAQEITYESTELAPGLYMLEGVGGFAGGNLGLATGEDGAFLIDNGLPPLTDEILEAIGELTDDPVEFLVNTHVHGDHIGGNEAFAQREATIVAHEKLRSRLVAEGVRTATGRGPAPEDALPVVTFSDAMTFHLNGRMAHVFHVAGAHTDGDAVIHFPEDNVIHAGDVFFNGMYPFIDLDSGGSVDGYLAAKEAILALADEETKIIPGHGPLATKSDLQKSVDMLTDARERVRKLVDQDHDADAVVEANPLGDLDEDWSWAFITTERMTRTLVRDVTTD